jgi:TolA-binding protein
VNALLVAFIVAAYQPSEGPPAALGGDLTRQKLSGAERSGPQSFRESVQLQVAEKRRELIAQLEKLLELTTKAEERPPLLFRLGDLYAEESQAYPDDREAQQAFGRNAVNAWTEIVQQHPAYERTDEVLYALGKMLIDLDDGRRALLALKRLIDRYPKSRFVPNARLAFGDWYFEHHQLDQAIDAYRRVDGPMLRAAQYKLGWCLFNQADYEAAMEQFRAVALAPRLDQAPQGLAKEARADFVRAFARSTRSVGEAHQLFNVLAQSAEELRTMNKQLAALYYDQGRAREAAVAFKGLIDERPAAPDAIGFQNHIVEVMLSTGNKRLVVEQLLRFKELGKPDPRSEALLSGVAVSWHKEWQRTRDRETAEQAADVYREYLALFPQHPRAYDLRFFYAELEYALEDWEPAAVAYAAVAKQPGKWREQAAYDAVLARQELARSEVAPAPSGVTESPMGPRTQALLEAIDQYLALLPNGADARAMAQRGGRLQYDHNRLRDASDRFHGAAVKWAGGDCAIAVNLSLDALNLLEEREELLRWVDEYLAGQCVAGDAQLRGELLKLRGRVQFERCTTASCFEAIEGELRDKALYKAAEKREQAKQLGEAIALRRQLLRDFPKSELAAKNAWALSQLCEQTADFAGAADAYEAYPANGPQAREAAFNVGVLRKELGQWQRALDARKKFLQRWPDDREVVAVVISIAELEELLGRPGNGARLLEEFAKTHPERAIELLGRAARLQSGAPAKRTYAKIATLSAGKKGLSLAELDAVGKAKLVAAEDELSRYGKLRFTWSQFRRLDELGSSVQVKTLALQALERKYIEVVAVGAPEPGVCALWKIGVLYDGLASAFRAVKVPSDAPKDLEQELPQILPCRPAEEKAREAFEAAVNKARELGVENECSTAAQKKLSRERLEEVPEMKLPSHR